MSESPKFVPIPPPVDPHPRQPGEILVVDKFLKSTIGALPVLSPTVPEPTNPAAPPAGLPSAKVPGQ